MKYKVVMHRWPRDVEVIAESWNHMRELTRAEKRRGVQCEVTPILPGEPGLPLERAVRIERGGARHKAFLESVRPDDFAWW